jgi:UPF0755 protein
MRRFALLVVLGVVLVAAWIAYALSMPYQGFPREGVYVDVPRGASARTIAGLLAENGVVRSQLAFEALCRWRGRALQAGEYFFDHPTTAFEVYQTLAEGRVFELEVTVPEGFTMFDIADLLADEGLTTQQAFLTAARDTTPIRDLAPGAQSLEGFLFPAIYKFPRHIAAQEIAQAMVRRFRETWQTLPAASARANGLSVEGVVALASLVERETSIPDERPLIAAVFTNRLRRGLALQCDPTVIYALQLAGKYRGSLTSPELRFDSPYNTYRRAGLPPGPIANPGEAALRAARAPSRVDYLYFVATGQGGHVFSKTLEEHNRNVTRYRRQLAQNAREQNSASKPGDPLGKKQTRKRSL